jgi:hypothetical protein
MRLTSLLRKPAILSALLLIFGRPFLAGAALDIDLENDASIDSANWALTDNGRTIQILNWDGTVQWNTVDTKKPEIVTEQFRAGGHSIKFCLLPAANANSSHRTEYKWLGPDQARWEETHFIGFSVRVPPDFPTSIQTWTIFFQLWQNPTSPPYDMEFVTVNGELRWHLILRNSSGSTSPIELAFPKDQWNDFVIQYRPDNNSADGMVRIWFNGKKVLDYKGMWGYNDGGAIQEGKFGFYRRKQNNTVTLYYDEIHWGNSFGEVYPGGAPAGAPSAAITTPTSGLQLTEGQSINMQAAAVDADGSVAKVEFLVDGVSVGQDSTAPYTVTIPPLHIGSHTLSAEATDNSGLPGMSAPVEVIVSGQPLPPPWKQADIGAVSKPGAASISSANQTFVVSGCGDDIWNAADAFHFVYQQIDGDFEIAARVKSVQLVDSWAKGGVMARQSLDANAANAFTGYTPLLGTFQSRLSAGQQSTSMRAPTIMPPRYIRLVRAGTTFTGYHSADAVTWTRISSATIAMPSRVYIGLAVSSHNPSYSCAADFDNVTITGTTVGTRPLAMAPKGVAGPHKPIGYYLLDGRTIRGDTPARDPHRLPAGVCIVRNANGRIGIVMVRH